MDEADQSQALFKKSSRPKKPTKVRLTLDNTEQDGIEDSQEVFKPKKIAGIRGQLHNRTPILKPERKSIYSNDYLNELRESTPTAPRDLPEVSEQNEASMTDIVHEIHDTTKETVPEILDESTIRHLKEQRDVRRRAGENYIPLADAPDVYKRDLTDQGKRLQTEDVVDVLGGDGTEGLAGYESDSLPLGQRNVQRADARKREEIETLIQERQDDNDLKEAQSSEESSDSDDEWERTQTRKTGTASAASVDQDGRALPPLIIPIPTVQQTLDKLRQKVDAVKKLVESKKSAIEQLEREQLEIAEQEEAIKAGLQRANLAFETAQLSIGGLETISQR